MDEVDTYQVPTPLSDEFATRPKAIFSNVAGWARGIERRAAVLKVRLDALEAETGTLIVQRARLQLDAFLAPRTGRFSRILARPPAQLAAGLPPRRIAESLIAKLLQQAETAVDVAQQLSAFEDQLAEDRARFGALLPNLTRTLLDHAQLMEHHVVDIVSIDGVERARRRHITVREKLMIYEEAAKEFPLAGVGHTITEDCKYTIDELHALLHLARVARARSTARSNIGAFVRNIAAKRLNELGRFGVRGAAGAESAALETLLERSQTLALRQTASRSHDAITMAGALGAGARSGMTSRVTRGRSENEFSWQPSFQAEEAEVSEREGAIEWSVISVVDDVVCLTRHDDSPLRLFNAGMTIAQEVEVVVKSGRHVGPDEAGRSDIDFLCDITDLRAGWFSQTKRAKVRLIATDGEVWFGQLLRKGLLTRRDRSGAKEMAPTGVVIKLLGPERDWGAVGLPQDVVLEGTPITFGGIQRHSARAGLQHAGYVVAHYAADSADEGMKLALVRERQFFEGIELQDGGAAGSFASVGITSVGTGMAPRVGECILYRASAGLEFRDDNSAAWLRTSDESTFAVAQSVAQIYQRVWQAKWSLATCTLSMFNFGLRWDPTSGIPLPVARLVTAPFATPLGARYLIPAAPQHGVTPRYERLGTPMYSSRLLQGETAMEGTDLFAWLYFCFELLAKSPIHYGEGQMPSWARIGMIASQGAQFRQARFVALANVVAGTPEGRRLIRKMFTGIVSGALGSFQACRVFLESEADIGSVDP
jgi:hypothetical protein